MGVDSGDWGGFLEIGKIWDLPPLGHHETSKSPNLNKNRRQFSKKTGVTTSGGPPLLPSSQRKQSRKLYGSLLASNSLRTVSKYTTLASSRRLLLPSVGLCVSTRWVASFQISLQATSPVAIKQHNFWSHPTCPTLQSPAVFLPKRLAAP